jgi:hypothetical protein
LKRRRRHQDIVLIGDIFDPAAPESSSAILEGIIPD